MTWANCLEFHDNPVSAATARKLGLPALVAADQAREELSFELAEASSACFMEDSGQALHKNVKKLDVRVNMAKWTGPEIDEALRHGAEAEVSCFVGPLRAGDRS